MKKIILASALAFALTTPIATASPVPFEDLAEFSAYVHDVATETVPKYTAMFTVDCTAETDFPGRVVGKFLNTSIVKLKKEVFVLRLTELLEMNCFNPVSF